MYHRKRGAPCNELLYKKTFMQPCMSKLSKQFGTTHHEQQKNPAAILGENTLIAVKQSALAAIAQCNLFYNIFVAPSHHAHPKAPMESFKLNGKHTFMMLSVIFRNPSSPRCIMLAQAVAISAPDLLPANPGEMYRPPVQSVMLVNWWRLQEGKTRQLA